MDSEKLINLIDRLQDYSQRNPAAYRLRVAALAALGYGYLLAVVLVLLLLIYVVLVQIAFNWLTVKFAWILLVLVGVVLRSMWVTLPEPDGRELHQENAPALFDLIKEVSAALHGPKVHRVFVSDEFNAGIVQIPQLGMFGWLRNYLVVGLPLLHALTPEEFRAVLAHEFGHLSGNHGRFSGWIYRLRQTWNQVLTTVHQEKRYASFLFEWFLNWYAPFFNAYSFVLARVQEYEADHYSVELAGKTVAARTLIRVSTKEKVLEEDFWPGFFKGANEEVQPPKDPFVRMLGGVALAVDRNSAEKWFFQSLKVKTGYDDTHPSLADRLSGMGYRKETLSSPTVIAELLPSEVADERSAAEFYLPSLPEGLLLSFNRLLRERIVPTWRERHKFIKEAQQRLSEIAEKSTKEPLTEEELWDRARLLSETQSTVAALPSIRAIVEKSPNHAGANFALGAILLTEDEESGVPFLEKSIELERSTTGDACELIYHFHRRHGREKEANVYRARAEQYAEELELHYQRAFNLSAKDNFEPHGLAAADLAEIQSQLRNIKRLGKAFLVRKNVGEGYDPLLVMAVISNYAWHDFHTRKDSDRLVGQLATDIQFPHHMLFVVLEGKNKSLRKVFSNIPGAEVFPF